MADDNKDKKKIAEQFGQELDILQDKLNNMASLLGNNMRNKLQDLATETGNFINEFEKGEDITKKLSAKLVTVQKDINKLSVNRLKLEQDLARVQQQGNVIAERRIREALTQNKLATQQLESHQTQLTALSQSTKEFEKQNSLGSKLNGFLDSNLKSVKDQVAQFFTLSGIIAIIIDGVGKSDKQIISMSKSLGVSREAAEGMRNEMESYSLASKDSFATVERLYKAQQGLSEQLGIAVNFSNEERENFARLTELVGLTNEEAGGLAKNIGIRA